MSSPFRKLATPARADLGTPTRLVLFKVDGRAVPWSVPDVRISRSKVDHQGNRLPGKRHTKKNPALRGWQDVVNFAARGAWGFGRAPYDGPVAISTWFYLRPPGERHVRTPDLTNLVKALEDAIKGPQGVIRDDIDVFASHGERFFVAPDEPEKAYCEVWAMPRGPIEPSDPGPYAYRPWQWEDAVSLAVG